MLFKAHTVSIKACHWTVLNIRDLFLDGRRKAGRPKLRWLGCIENDMESMGVERSRKKAEDRSVCVTTLKKALSTTAGMCCDVI